MQTRPSIRLIARADDMAVSHGANLACLEAYQHGIVRSVELMAPCGWFPEAVELLRTTPDLEVGVHLTLTSEWDAYKWRPLTHAPSLVTPDGFFFPRTSHREGSPPPNTTSVKSRGSWPRLTLTSFSALTMLELAMRTMPRATSASVMFSRVASAPSAVPSAPMSATTEPPQK